MLGELAAVRGAIERRRALFLMPLKALVNDKLRQFRQVYGPFGIRTIEASGETDDITPLLRGQYDIALLTYEKFSAIALTHPYVLEQVGTIVVDEVQMIADASRGANLEFILTLLRMRRKAGFEPQLIALSAVIGDTSGGLAAGCCGGSSGLCPSMREPSVLTAGSGTSTAIPESKSQRTGSSSPIGAKASIATG
jgi:replicative superfamily II helicase